MQLLLIIASLTSFSTALTTSAQKHGKKEVKVNATFDDVPTRGPSAPGQRHPIEGTYKYLLWDDFTVGAPVHDSSNKCLWQHHHTSAPGNEIAAMSISKFHAPIITSFDLRTLQAGCYNSRPETVGGEAIGCTIQFSGTKARDPDDKDEKQEVVTFDFVYRVNETDGRGVSVLSQDLQAVKLPKSFKGLERCEFKVLEDGVRGDKKMASPRLVFDDVEYKVKGKGLKKEGE